MTHVATGYPCGARCESCGSAGPGLAVVVLDVLGVVLCMTMCRTCATSGEPPSILVRTAAKLAAQHAEHVAPQRERIRLRVG